VQDDILGCEASLLEPGERRPHVPHLPIAHSNPLPLRATLGPEVNHQHTVSRPGVDGGGLEDVPIRLVAPQTGNQHHRLGQVIPGYPPARKDQTVGAP
jgi:hypothetical protein